MNELNRIQMNRHRIQFVFFFLRKKRGRKRKERTLLCHHQFFIAPNKFKVVHIARRRNYTAECTRSRNSQKKWFSCWSIHNYTYTPAKRPIHIGVIPPIIQQNTASTKESFDLIEEDENSGSRNRRAGVQRSFLIYSRDFK